MFLHFPAYFPPPEIPTDWSGFATARGWDRSQNMLNPSQKESDGNGKAREKATDQVCRCFCTSLPSSLLLKFHTSYPPSPPARPVCMHYFDFYDLFSQKIISLNVKGIVFDASAVISFKGFIFP